jgi:hypothetical protein
MSKRAPVTDVSFFVSLPSMGPWGRDTSHMSALPIVGARGLPRSKPQS